MDEFAPVLVCGSRDLAPRNLYDLDRVEFKKQYRFIMDGIEREVQKKNLVHDEEYRMPKVRIVSGGADGVDTVAEDWAVVNWCPTDIIKPDWDKHGKKAGILRNLELLDKNPILVIAFFKSSSNLSKGTSHTVREAKKRRIEVAEYYYE